MQKVRRLISTVQPKTIDSLGDGNYYYNYNIVSHTEEEDREGTIINVTYYEYTQVMLYGHPNYEDCVRAIIRQYVSIDDEFDIINTANRLIREGKDTPEYDKYLELLDNIKINVKKDFNHGN